jgi:hypothetical protein
MRVIQLGKNYQLRWKVVQKFMDIELIQYIKKHIRC